MDRFVAMIWKQEDLARQRQVNAWSETLQRQSPKWVRTLDAPGLRVFSYHHRGGVPVVTRWQGEDGIAIGVLFKRGDEKTGRVLSVDRSEAAEIATSHGEKLIKNYWGNYVAIWCKAETRQTSILRDPCGAAACFMTRQKGVELVFAHAEDVANLPDLSFSIDWAFLQSFLVWRYFSTPHTGLNEVKEVQAGQRIEIAPNGDRSSSWAWDAAEVAAAPNLQDFDNAKAELRATAEACFTAWGKEYRNIVVRLSGGLDSSIVLNLLRRVSDARITAQHLVGAGYDAYELQLARLSAKHAGVELQEPPVPMEINLRRMLDLPRLMRPSLHMMGTEGDDVMSLGADMVGADSFMGGQGGDQLFMQQSTGAYALADYVRLNGIRPASLRVAYETAMMTKGSIWKAIGNAVDTALLDRTWHPYAFLDDEKRNRDRLIRQQIVDSIPNSYVFHPWLTRAERLPRGIGVRVKEMIALHNYHIRFGFGLVRDAVSPLFCQPIVEFALRTPTYIFGKDGMDRALERRTFADLIPDAVFRRTDKGGVGHTVAKQLPQNIAFCRELILGGEFAAQGWIDAAKADRMLSIDYLASGKGMTFAQTLLVVEAWAAKWRAEGVRAAA